MRLFGWQITKAAVAPSDLSAFDSRLNGRGWTSIQEPFTGAWQRNLEQETPASMMGFAPVYACVSRIAQDIGKLGILLKQYQQGVWLETTSSAYSPVLRRPNGFQTWMQFIVNWICSKRMNGNTYVWKERDNRNVVIAMYVLDPCRVSVKVAADGSVWYELKRDDLAGLPQESILVPASEIIHDRCITPWHPLVGVSPLFAHAMSATQGMRIQGNSATFFENASRPGGILSPKMPGEIPEAQIEPLKSKIEQATTGQNVGRLLLFRNEMMYQAMSIPAADAQLTEQLRWTVEDVGRAHGMPLYKLGIGQPTFNNIGQLQQEYYAECLQVDMEAIEALLAIGLALPVDVRVEFDLDSLMRMDPLTQAQMNSEGVKGGWMSPNEARQRVNLVPVDGGDAPYLQQQNWTLEQLAERPAPVDKPSVSPPPGEPAPAESTPNKAAAETEFSEFELLGMKAMAEQLIERARVGGTVG